ncbi:Hypothetical_protein [Hexamita inflata]|uniref:Hypothetical_protein n=1 Tax=Hexamita inflata TaxID=28002 RepID=A0AA86NAR1_9EUKA|nr:Hypothetical protein HINF_LOCUS3398 [Hexamita inflata]
MPFVIQTNNNRLELQYCDDEQQNIDIDALQSSYAQIHVNGFDNQFPHYDILCKSQHIEMYDCGVDLNELRGEYTYLLFEQCKCSGEFTSQCKIGSLIIFDTTLLVQQMLSAQFNDIYCYIEHNNSFDYHNCYQLKCQSFKELSISNQVVTLSKLIGKCEDLSLTNCEFIDYTFEDFQVENVFLTITQQNYTDNLLKRININCGILHVFFQDFSIDCPIILQFPKSIAYQKSAKIKNCACDLSAINEKWDSICFTDCVLLGSLNSLKFVDTIKVINKFVDLQSLCSLENSSSEFISTKIVVNNTKQFDLSALHGIKAYLVISLQDQIVNLNLLSQIRPQDLTLEKCQIELTQDITLSKITLIDCEISGNHQIKANDIIITRCESMFDKIQADNLTVHGSKVTFLNAKSVTLFNSELKCELNDQVTSLQLRKCKLIQFSCLKYKQLEQFMGNFDERDQTTAAAIAQYIKAKRDEGVRKARKKFLIENQRSKYWCKWNFNRILIATELILERKIYLQLANE